MTESNRLGITELSETQTDRHTVVNEMLAKLEAGACMFGAESVSDNAPPGSPAEGDIYIVGTAGSGAFSGHNEEVAIYYNGAWLFLPALAGMLAYADDEDAFYYFDGANWVSANLGGGGTSTPMPVPMAYAGGPPTSSEIMGGIVATNDIDFAANFSGSSGYIGTNPTSSFVISVKDDGVEIGTITISAGGAFTFATSGGTAKTVAAGSRIEFVAPASADATAAYILATIKGTA